MLTDAEQQRVLFHLSYTQLSTPTTLSLGLPIVTQARFVVDMNMFHIKPMAESVVREVIAKLECILKLIEQAQAGLLIKRSGDTEFRDDAIDRLWIEYSTWRSKLADALGTQVNPVSNELAGRFGGVAEGC